MTTQNILVSEIFNSNFRFSINDSVRHKGDNHKHDSDMGLLIIERHIIESMDAENNVVYERSYVCRMIRWSGSGDLARFSERELISVAEYEKERIEHQREINEMKHEAKMCEKEMAEMFDVSKDDYLYEIVDGVPDKTKKFRWTGFSSQGTKMVLIATESLITANTRLGGDEKIKRESREWSDKSQFVKVENS